jgi:hypothetical protein
MEYRFHGHHRVREMREENGRRKEKKCDVIM